MQLALPGAPPQQSASQVLRSSDGQMRMDYGDMSVITNPAAPHAIVLDHIKLVARLIPIPQMPQLPKIPQLGMPGAPGAPTPPPMSAVDLGKGFIEGHEVSGMQMTFHMPSMPGAPGTPSAPGLPTAPGMPTPPAMPVVAEVWTSVSLSLPVLTKISGSFGMRTCYCKNAPTSEPPPAAFQIPPGYALVK